jgi:succinyl-CoA synthetase alpha subunit
MSVLINADTKVLVQGITGRSGALQTQTLIEYGTRIVAGVTPGKGGMIVHDIPVFDFVSEAVSMTPCLFHHPLTEVPVSGSYQAVWLSICCDTHSCKLSFCSCVFFPVLDLNFHVKIFGAAICVNMMLGPLSRKPNILPSHAHCSFHRIRIYSP